MHGLGPRSEAVHFALLRIELKQRKDFSHAIFNIILDLCRGFFDRVPALRDLTRLGDYLAQARHPCRDAVDLPLNLLQVQLAARFLANGRHGLHAGEFGRRPQEQQWSSLGQRRLVHGAVEIVVDALEVAELHRLAALGEDKDAADGFAVFLRFL